MSDPYKLCRQAGLMIFTHSPLRSDPIASMETFHSMVQAADVEAMLASAPVVYGNHDVEGWRETKHECDTHTARLLMVETIPEIAAESEARRLLRELIAETDSWGRSPDGFERIKARAKKLLGEN